MRWPAWRPDGAAQDNRHARRLVLFTVGAVVSALGLFALDNLWPAAHRATAAPVAKHELPKAAAIAGAAPALPPDVALPQPSGSVGGVPIGYPHTTAGAVAAAYGYSRVATGLDVVKTLQAISSIADPASGWFASDRGRIADGLVAQRQSLGLPPAGVDTTGASIVVSPSGYRILRAGADDATVLTLDVIGAQNTDGSHTTGTVVFKWVLRWDGSRWRATQTYIDDADAATAVVPETTAAEQIGWKDATGG